MQGARVRGLKHHCTIIPVCKTNVSKFSDTYCQLNAYHLQLIRSGEARAVLHCSMSALRLPAPLSACLQAEAAQHSCRSRAREGDGNGPSASSSVCGRKIEVGTLVQGTQSVRGVGLGTCLLIVGLCYSWVFAFVKSFPKYEGEFVIPGYSDYKE